MIVAAIGYESKERRISEETSYEIKLTASSSALNEVVVVGYSTQMKKSITASVSSVSENNFLAGKVAGLQVTIRGVSSVADSESPLLIVDGVPFTGKLDSASILSINVMKPAEATGLYGSRAAAGVIIITTKKAVTFGKPIAEGETPQLANVIRRNFNDAAYWQPKLITDKDGKTSFTTTFPDDITKWRTFAIASTGKKQTGFAEGHIKSFKAISANIAVPSFTIEGDSINVIGKVLNYTLDTLQVKKRFTVNDAVVKDTFATFRNSIIDTFLVVGAKSDSMKFKYTVQKTDGYFDGEERGIPVFKQGTKETKGYFAALNKDTTFILAFDTGAGKIKIYAESSALPVLLDEIETIHQYEYFCNEQLASKLKALLLKKKIYSYLKKDFTEEKNINAIVAKLSQNKSPEGLWGWWSNNETSLWISTHTIEALLLAEKAGFAILLNKELIKDYLIYNFYKYNTQDQISSISLLKLLDAKVDFNKYTDTLGKRIVSMSLYQQLQFLQLKQQLKMPVVLDTLTRKFRSTMFGNLYWGEENNSFFNNATQNTLLMYRLMKTAGGYEGYLQKIRNYFLEKRKDGKWNNTYESSLILETILPDILKESSVAGPATLTINELQPVKTFPYVTELENTNKLIIKKQGNWPVYFTAYQQYWNSNPQKKDGDFNVNSFFEKNDQKIATLKAGEPITMKVNVSVRADADYVMIEIPIPAGCSYKDKNQQWANNEVHREFFKNKVSIFCKSLGKGNYTFTVSLIPKFTGIYHLNPAKAEMMYFPIFYGREAMKKVQIN